MKLTFAEAQQIRAQRRKTLVDRLTRDTRNVTPEQVAAEQAAAQQAAAKPRTRAQKSE